MHFEQLKDELNNRGGRNRSAFLGTDIGELRVKLLANIIDMLSGDRPLLGSPYHPEDPLTNLDNQTNATWLASQLVFCLTQFYVHDELGSAIENLPDEIVRKVMKQVDASDAEVLSCLVKAKRIEGEKLLKAGALACAFQRLV